MLKAIQPRRLPAGKGRFAIVASQYNARYVNGMVAAARARLKRAGAKKLELIRVPGAFEIPLVAARLAHTASDQASALSDHESLSAIICLGVILRGETVHAAHIGEAVTRALMQTQLRYGIPIIHEVLLLENEQQARARCLSKTHNRGAEAAQTALAMARVLETLSPRRWRS